MKKEKEYEQHIRECLAFAQCIADVIVGQDKPEMSNDLQLAIFDKVCTPLYYFLQSSEPGETSSQPPTEKQIAYAKQLGIADPEQFSKEDLSKKIDEVLKSKRK